MFGPQRSYPSARELKVLSLEDATMRGKVPPPSPELTEAAAVAPDCGAQIVHRRGGRGLLVVVGLSALVGAAAGAWLLSRQHEAPLRARTRRRLLPRTAAPPVRNGFTAVAD